jgi:Uma2 family endonuclease
VLAINPRKRTVTVFRSLNTIFIVNEDSVLDLEDIVPGFEVAVQEIFR